jgi:hypothetical protein
VPRVVRIGFDGGRHIKPVEVNRPRHAVSWHSNRASCPGDLWSRRKARIDRSARRNAARRCAGADSFGRAVENVRILRREEATSVGSVARPEVGPSSHARACSQSG